MLYSVYPVSPSVDAFRLPGPPVQWNSRSGRAADLEVHRRGSRLCGATDLAVHRTGDSRCVARRTWKVHRGAGLGAANRRCRGYRCSPFQTGCCACCGAIQRLASWPGHLNLVRLRQRLIRPSAAEPDSAETDWLDWYPNPSFRAAELPDGCPPSKAIAAIRPNSPVDGILLKALQVRLDHLMDLCWDHRLAAISTLAM